MKPPKILDNKKNGRVIDEMRFIFTEPTFANNDQKESKEFYIEHNAVSELAGNEFEMKLRNEMKQAAIARECAEWLKEKVQELFLGVQLFILTK